MSGCGVRGLSYLGAGKAGGEMRGDLGSIAPSPAHLVYNSRGESNPLWPWGLCNPNTDTQLERLCVSSLLWSLENSCLILFQDSSLIPLGHPAIHLQACPCEAKAPPLALWPLAPYPQLRLSAGSFSSLSSGTWSPTFSRVHQGSGGWCWQQLLSWSDLFGLRPLITRVGVRGEVGRKADG